VCAKQRIISMISVVIVVIVIAICCSSRAVEVGIKISKHIGNILSVSSFISVVVHHVCHMLPLASALNACNAAQASELI